MPTARRSPSVLSHQSALVVVGGGLDTTSHYSDAVEIFRSDILQWYKTGHLPVRGCLISLVAIGSTCYALGGWNSSHLNRALYASVDDLLGNAVPANQTTSRRGSSDTQSVWKTLPNTPTYRPTAAVLAGNLLAIGGKKTQAAGGADKNEVYMYCPSTNSWIYIFDLPAPRSDTGAAVLSSTEILVVGGFLVNTVYKGTLYLKQ